MSDTLGHKILDILKEYTNANHEYINPHFIDDIVYALEEHYNLSDDDVDKWLQEMFSA